MERIVMKKLVAAAFILCGILFCSCGSEDNGEAVISTDYSDSLAYDTSAVTETSEISETSGTVTEKSSTEVPEENTEFNTETEIEIAVTERAVSLTVSSEKPAAASAIPVLTVSNVDCETNRLTWTAIDSASSYMLYLYNAQTGTFEEYGEISGTACNDKRLVPDTKYIYGIAAKLPDGSTGKMSDIAKIYTYSHRASRVQGNWIYYYNKEEKSLRRINRSGDIDEKVFDSDEEINFPLVSPNYIYYRAYNDDRNSLYRVDLDGKNKKELVGFSDESNYSLDDIAVYDDIVYYSYHGAHMETDRDSNRFCSVSPDGKAAGDFYTGYQPVYFFEDENGGFCAAWRGEEIDSEASDEENEIITNKTEDYYIYREETGKTETIKLPAELTDAQNIEACRYIDGAIWVYANFIKWQKFGCITADGKFEETELPVNADYPDVSYDGKEIYFQTSVGKPDESGQYSWINTEKTLCRLEGGNTKELAELNVDPTFDFKSYELGREHILYTDSGGAKVYWDISEDKRVPIA